MWLYILGCISFILLSACLIAVYKAQSYYLQYQSTSSYIAKLEQELREKNTLYEQTREQLHTAETQSSIYQERIHEINSRLGDIEHTKNLMMEHAKAAVFEVGNQLSSKLIDDHKRETEEAKKANQQASIQFNEQFAQIVTSVTELETRLKDSSNTVEIIKQALLSPGGAGSLAEVTLENILKSSGLLPGIDFVMQYSVDNAQTHGVKQRPDAVVFLPSGNVMIIDSKASKFFFELDSTEEENAERLKHTMRTHLKDLSSKDYRESVKGHLHKELRQVSHISTIMFLPSELALEKIQRLDSEFLQKAWDLHIFPAGPIGMINILAHAKFHIFEQKKMSNYEEIIEEVRKILIGISRLQEHARKMGTAIHSAASNYDKFVASFNSNLLSRGKNLQKLGIDSQTPFKALDRYQIIAHTQHAPETLEEPSDI